MPKGPIFLAISLVAAGLAAGLIGNIAFGWDWLLTTVLALALLTMAMIALAAFDASHPPSWGGGSWSSYIEMTGHEARGSGPSDMTRPASGGNTWLLASALGPTVAIIILLVFAWFA